MSRSSVETVENAHTMNDVYDEDMSEVEKADFTDLYLQPIYDRRIKKMTSAYLQ